MDSLEEQADYLATSLNSMLNGTVCDDAEVSSIFTPESTFIIGNRVTADAVDGELMPLHEHGEHLFLRAHWRLGPSGTGEYLRTDWSQFALFVWGPGERPKPLIRLEVTAEQDREAWNVAHFHVHGASQLLGQVWGLRQAEIPKQLEDLHFPVGGFHYRPCLEDFIEFLVKEDFVTPKQDWQEALAVTRDEYRTVQLRALVQRNPEVAKGALADLDQNSDE